MYWGWLDMNEIVAELQRIGPYWDRKGGADHIFTVTADPGRCQYANPSTRKAIYLHHMGMLRHLTSARCNLFETWGGDCDGQTEAALGATTGNLKWGCHLPYQDIVVPPSPYEYDKEDARSEAFESPYINQGLMGLDRTKKLYYAGEIGERPNSD